jgi:hypothetical protein
MEKENTLEETKKTAATFWDKISFKRVFWFVALCIGMSYIVDTTPISWWSSFTAWVFNEPSPSAILAVKVLLYAVVNIIIAGMFVKSDAPAVANSESADDVATAAAAKAANARKLADEAEMEAQLAQETAKKKKAA